MKRTGRVKKCLYHDRLFWKEIRAFDFVYLIIDKGYSLHFESYPPSMNFENNKSALLNAVFVSEAVQELIDSGRVVQHHLLLLA